MQEKILVLGAGTGGLVAANLLASKGRRVVLVEKSETHLFQPGMLWIAFKGHPPERYLRPVRELVRSGVELVRGDVKSVSLAERKVILSDGRELGYDVVIIALGARLDYDAVPGHRELVEKHGDYFAGPSHAARLWESFRRLEKGTLLVAAADPLYKCPPAPHKAALLASDTLRRTGRHGRVRVVLALPFLHAYPSREMADIVEPVLRESGVEVRTMFTVDSIDVSSGVALSVEGESVRFDLATVIPLHSGPAIDIDEDVTDDDGYIKVDKHTLQIEGYDDAYAIGDCTNAPTSKTGVTAHLGAEVVADRIEGLDARFTGRTNCPIVADGTASFVISDYNHPPVRAYFTRAKRLMEDFFIAAYWSSLRYPERWRPLFHAYFQATRPEALREGW